MKYCQLLLHKCVCMLDSNVFIMKIDTNSIITVIIERTGSLFESESDLTPKVNTSWRFNDAEKKNEE